MEKFLNFVSQFKELIVFLALVIISLSLISLDDVSKIGGFRTVVIGTVGWFQRLFAWIPNPGALESENRAIRELNIQLSEEVMRMREALHENQRLRKMLELKEKTTEDLVIAEVVGKSTVQLRNYITIDKGRNSGIDYGMSVRTDAGLVGIVIGLTDNFSLVELILNRNVRIACRFQRTGINGIITWEGGEHLLVKNIPQSFDVAVGDVIETSNYSNRYPNYIPIGKVINVEADKGSLFKKILVEPYANFNSLDQVFVVRYIPDRERIELLKEMEESLRIKLGQAGR